MGAVALPLALAGFAAAAPPKEKEPAAAAEPSTSQLADELRILRADLESIRRQPEGADLGALRAEVSRLAAAQAELERRLGGPSGAVVPVSTPSGGGGLVGGVASALLFLALGAALGWVGSRLAQRWRDRRLRIRV